MVKLKNTDDAIKWFTQSYRFLYAANTLMNSSEYKQTNALFTPTLHMAAHGIELLLKANLLYLGVDARKIRNSFGHDLRALWLYDLNCKLRNEAEEIAANVWMSAHASRNYVDSFDGDPKALLVEYLFALSDLHTSASNYALRYISDDSTLAPLPYLLVETFYESSDRQLRRLHTA